MTIDLLNFFRLSRLFDFRPAPLSEQMLTLLIIVFGTLVVVGIAAKIYRQLAKKDNYFNQLVDKYFILSVTMGVLGLIWVWFRLERVTLLSARFWLVLWIAGLIIWLVSIIKFQTKTIPKMRNNIAKKKEFERYLPKKR